MLGPVTIYEKLLKVTALTGLRRLFGEFSNHRGRIAWILALGLVIAAIQPACVKLTQQIVDGLKSGEIGLGVGIVPQLLVVLFLVNGIAKYFHNTQRRYVAEKIVVKLRQRLFEKYLTMSQYEIDGSRTGELLAKMQNDLVQIGQGMDTLCDILREPLTFFGLLGIAFYCDWQLTTLTMFITPLVILLFSRSGAAVKRYSESNLAQFSDLISLSQESLVGSRVVKVFRLERTLRKKFSDIHDSYFRTLLKSIRVQELSTPLVEFIGAILMAGVIAYGGARVSAGVITTGELIAFIIAMGLVQMPIKKLNNAYLKLKVAEAAVRRVYDLVDDRSGEESFLDTSNFKRIPLSRTIAFENVSLHYGNKQALEEVSFEVNVGEVVALVGESGSGKTSIVNLIPRLYEVSGGRITLDGTDIRDYDLGPLRDLISVVTQDVFLFNDTIYENILYGNPRATREQVMRAAEHAHCLDFIHKCPRGVETSIGDRGMSLSGGERQRVAIARAMLKDSPILILDEATSNLDSRSEKLVQEALNELMNGRTTFVVAHRLSTIRRASQILVIHEGRIVERGNHETLVLGNGAYQNLYDQQYSPTL